MRITAWRYFLAAGLVATAGYYLLPDTVRVVAASSALYHYAGAVAVMVGIRPHRPVDAWPWYLIGMALLAFGTGAAIQFASTVGDLSDLCFDVVLEVGAGTGILSLSAATAGARKVFAVEIDEYLCECLEETIRANGLTGIIEILPTQRISTFPRLSMWSSLSSSIPDWSRNHRFRFSTPCSNAASPRRRHVSSL